jgi:hypothetical protein
MSRGPWSTHPSRVGIPGIARLLGVSKRTLYRRSYFDDDALMRRLDRREEQRGDNVQVTFDRVAAEGWSEEERAARALPAGVTERMWKRFRRARDEAHGRRNEDAARRRARDEAAW